MTVGMRVRYTYGKPEFGTITGTKDHQFVMVHLDDDKESHPYNPWELEYLEQ